MIPKLLPLPTLFAQKVGVVLKKHNLKILKGIGSTQVRWEMEIIGSNSEVTLLELPVGLTPLLTVGTEYGLTLLAIMNILRVLE